MRHVLFVAIVLLGSGSHVIGSDPVEQLSLEVSANRAVKFTDINAVLRAACDCLGDGAQVTISVQAKEGIAVKVRASSAVPYRRLAVLLAALGRAGVNDITLTEPAAD